MTWDLAAFNLLMIAVDLAALAWVFNRPTLGRWLMGGIVGGSLGTFLAGFLSRDSFSLATLAAYVLFVYGSLFLVVSAALLWRRARKTAVLSALLAVAVLAVAVEAFLIEPTWLEVSHLTFRSRKLSRRVRLVVLADFQTDQIGAYERRVIEEVLRQEPDVILLAGDYLDAEPEDCGRLAREANVLLRELDFRAPEGVYAVQGNIDRWRPWTKVFDGLPVQVMMRTQTLDVAGLRLTCLSLADSFDTRLRVSDEGSDRFHLVLGHGPNFAMGKVKADLLVAGHTHGGQVRLPWIGTLTTGCRVPRAWAAGVTRLPSGAALVVSRGTGMERGTAPELRFLCRPELVVIDLVPE